MCVHLSHNIVTNFRNYSFTALCRLKVCGCWRACECVTWRVGLAECHAAGSHHRTNYFVSFALLCSLVFFLHRLLFICLSLSRHSFSSLKSPFSKTSNSVPSFSPTLNLCPSWRHWSVRVTCLKHKGPMNEGLMKVGGKGRVNSINKREV